MTNQIMQAFKIAMKAHEGQTDKAGMPYILHPLTVATAQETEEAFIAGLLHDVVEDSDYTFDDLRAAGIAENIIEALMLLTHDKNDDDKLISTFRSIGMAESKIEKLLNDKDNRYMAYISAIMPNDIARAVKLADLRHNADLSRLPEVRIEDIERAEKYNRAAELLITADIREGNPFRAKYGMDVMTFARKLAHMPEERVREIADMAERRVPKAEAGIRNMVESAIYDDVLADAMKHAPK